jgi:hypothetical protein
VSISDGEAFSCRHTDTGQPWCSARQQQDCTSWCSCLTTDVTPINCCQVEECLATDVQACLAANHILLSVSRRWRRSWPPIPRRPRSCCTTSGRQPPGSALQRLRRPQGAAAGPLLPPGAGATPAQHPASRTALQVPTHISCRGDLKQNMHVMQANGADPAARGTRSPARGMQTLRAAVCTT